MLAGVVRGGGYGGGDVFLAVLVVAVDLDGAAGGGDERHHLLVGQHFVQPRLLDVDNLAANGQDRLRGAVARLFGAAARRVPLDDEDLRDAGVAALAIGQLARQAAAFQEAFAARQFAGLLGRQPCSGRLTAFRQYLVALARVLREVVRQRL